MQPPEHTEKVVVIFNYQACCIFTMNRGHCKTCGEKTEHPYISHCSNKCLFANIWNSKSISGIPIEKWDDEEPWI